MHIGHNQMWGNYNPYAMGYHNAMPEPREHDMFNNKFYPPPNSKHGKNFVWQMLINRPAA